MEVIIYSILSAFLGYLIGRIGDYFAGHWNFFHHWVYGAIMVIVGIIYWANPLFIYLAFFGVGSIISDFEDLLHFRIYGPDVKDRKKFWAFD
jgi:hypothetical protein